VLPSRLACWYYAAKAAAFAAEGSQPTWRFGGRYEVEGSDALFTVAELAIAFAGFASLAAVIGRRHGGDRPEIDALRLRNMLEASLREVTRGASSQTHLRGDPGSSRRVTFLERPLFEFGDQLVDY
jgi:hypothetical protein